VVVVPVVVFVAFVFVVRMMSLVLLLLLVWVVVLHLVWEPSLLCSFWEPLALNQLLTLSCSQCK
jgi:hypothetical protein